MTRDAAYKLIDEERSAQDRVWRVGRKTEAQYAFAAPHILLLEAQVAKLRAIWYGSKDEGDLQERLVKTAAVAVRALEEIQ